MTISIAWVRKTKTSEQMLFVSDSRLSGGELFDCCPKIVCLSERFAIAFAGNSDRAFPMMIQLSLAIESHRPSRLGLLTISEIKGHALKIFDHMASQIKNSHLVNLSNDVLPGVSFLLGGYSWERKRFELWSIRYNSGTKHFDAAPGKWLSFKGERFILGSASEAESNQCGSLVAIEGDQAQRAKTLLSKKLLSRFPNAAGFNGLQMEPFEVVRDMLRESAHSETIGGAPQIVQVTQGLVSDCLGVFWPNKESKNIFLQGRRLLKYERIENAVLDPDTFRLEHPWLIDTQMSNDV